MQNLATLRTPLAQDSQIIEAKHLGQDETGDANVARLHKLKEGDVVTAKLFRFDPTQDSAPRYEIYKVPYSQWMRVLDVLNYIAEDLKKDIGYRWFCSAKKCGTCAVRMNGREVLACWEAAEPEMVIEPLKHLPVLRDLLVDRTPYEDRIYRMKPLLERRQPYGEFPEHLTHREMAKASSALDCLSCMACYSACPVLDLGDETRFSGPAPLVQFAQRALDPRDGGVDRGSIVLEEASIFSCVSCYKCEEVCPANIPIVSGVIEPLKAMAFRSASPRDKHAQAFLEIIGRRGRIDPSALVLKTQGIKALRARNIRRILKLLIRGKINPLKTFFGAGMPQQAQIKKLYELFGR